MQQPLIGITGERKPAAALVDVIEIIRSLDIDVFYGDYARAVTRAGGIPVWVGSDTPIEVVDRLDGLVLSGGDDIDPAGYGQDPHPEIGTPSPERDLFEASLFSAACEVDLPVLGVCRGIQLINVHHGGSLAQHVPDHTGSGLPVDHLLHRVAFEPDSDLAAIYGEEIEVNSLHHQGLDKLGLGLRAVGRTVGGPDDGLVEAIEVDGKPVIAVQWHPELLGGVDPSFTWLVKRATQRHEHHVRG